jgi:hypothetical protein
MNVTATTGGGKSEALMPGAKEKGKASQKKR